MIIVVTTAFAVIIGMLVLVWRKSADQNKEVMLNVPPKLLGVSADDDEVDVASGKTKVTIFYGIQTGTAEGFAKGLTEEITARYGKAAVKVVDLDDYAVDDDQYEEKLKKENLAFFMVAAYGDGEPTDNAGRFYKWFTEGYDKGAWLQQQYIQFFILFSIVLDHLIELFCKQIAKVLDEQLCEQGGKHLFSAGLGGDNQCSEDDFVVWYSVVLIGFYIFLTPSYLQFILRRELPWPELDKLLRGEDDANIISMPYTVAVPEYRVVIHYPTVTSYEDNYANDIGSASFDIHNPCRCGKMPVRYSGAYLIVY